MNDKINRKMNLIKTLTRYAFYTLLCLFFLSSCKDTYYQYDIDNMEETCKDKGGINRFNSDVDKINCWCNDGSFHKLNSK